MRGKNLPDEPEPQLIGYARVSTADQSLEAQVKQLRDYGVPEENIFKDQLSALAKRRRGFELCLKHLRRGDTLVVASLSRLGRSVEHLLALNKRLLEEGVTLMSLSEKIDTRTADGKLLFTVRAAFAQFERDITIERTIAGQAARKAAGFKVGRPSRLTPAQMKAMERDMGNPKLTLKDIGKKYGVHWMTVKYHFPKNRAEYARKLKK